MSIIRSSHSQLSDDETNLTEELNWLATNDDYHRYALLSYYDNKDVILYPDRINLTTLAKDKKNKPSKSAKDTLPGNYILDKETKSLALHSSKVLVGCTKKSSSQSPYMFYDALRDCTYSMITDGTIEKNNLLLRLAGFIEWLNIQDSDLLTSNTHDDMEYLFLWLVRSIQNSNGDVLTGLHKGLSTLSKYNVGGLYNILFSDGNGVYAFSNLNPTLNTKQRMSYKISRNVHSICSYIIRNHSDSTALDWTNLKEHNLYYFPIQGAMQVYANIDTNQYSDSKYRTGVNWVCLSLLSC